jgi:hypothetical protein
MSEYEGAELAQVETALAEYVTALRAALASINKAASRILSEPGNDTGALVTVCTIERINELVIALNAVHADYLEARKRRDAREAELVEARTAFLTSSAIQAAAVEEAHKACDAWAEQDQESARKALVLMAERDAALNRLSAMCEHRWQCYGLKRDDGATFWYVRDRNNRITDGCATPEQAIDSAINRAQELNRKLASGKVPSDQDLGFRFSARDFGV